MTDLSKAAELALEALEDVFDLEKKDVAAIQALRQALAQEEKPPVKSYCGGKPNYCTPEVTGETVTWSKIDDPNKWEQEPLGSEWVPCVKLPVIVHVRNQRGGENHISTREGITPVLPEDLIMRGVAGEEYPIGRELFERTYTFDVDAVNMSQERVDETAKGKHEWVGLTDEKEIIEMSKDAWGRDVLKQARDDHSSFYVAFARAIEAKLKEKNHG